MRVWALRLALCVGLVVPLSADVGSIGISTSLPMTCSVGYMTYLTTGTVGFYVCTATDTWQLIGAPGAQIPSGSILLIVSGTCPTGFTESAALNGKMLRGTVAANMDVGGTGGSDSITPTVASLTAAAQTFTGSSANTSLVSAGTPAGTNGTVSITPLLNAVAWPAGVPTYTGTVNTLAVTAHTVVATKQGTAAGNVVTTATHTITGIPGGTVAWPAGVPTVTGASTTVGAETFTGTALGTHQHALTATGTNGTSSVTGTLNSVDNRPAYTSVIFCQKT